MNSAVLDFLSTRSSAPIAELKAPAPSDAEIETLIRIATRVPSYCALAPEIFTSSRHFSNCDRIISANC